MTEVRNQAAGGKPAHMAALAGKYLTFRLANEEYGLEIIKVQEIIGLMPVTHVPRVPEYVRGVINLRGRIIPTIDLRSKFNLERVPDTDKTCIIVVEVMSPKGGKMSMGIIVDEVAEVLEVPVSHFLGEQNKVIEDWLLHDPPMRVPYFDVFGHKVWGATAMVLAEFAAVLSDASDLKPT